MRVTRYSRWTGFDWDDINLQELMESLSEHLLQSGFQSQLQRRLNQLRDADGGELDPNQALEELRHAIREALKTSGLLSDEQYQDLFDQAGKSKDERLEKLIDQLIARLLQEGYLKAENDGSVLDWYFDENGKLKFRASEGSGSTENFREPQVTFELTAKGLDFLGYQSLKSLLGGFGRGTFGHHDTNSPATGVEASEATKPYEFGDLLNLDVTETLIASIKRNGMRTPLEIDYQDLQVRQANFQSSCATVLMLDCSHSMILYGEDRFTPAKRVALALSQLIRTQYPGDSLRLILFHDAAEEIPLSRLPSLQVGPYHTNTCEGLRLARRILQHQRADMKQILMITDGKPSALFVGDTFEAGANVQGDSVWGRRLYKNSFGLDPMIIDATLAEARECKRRGIMLNTFMLTDDAYLMQFVRLLTQAAAGKAYFTSVDNLGQYLMMDFVTRKSRRI